MSSLRAWLLHPVLERIDRMSESTTAAIADLAAIEAKQAADIAQLKTDVTAALAVIASAQTRPASSTLRLLTRASLVNPTPAARQPTSLYRSHHTHVEPPP